MPQIKIIFPCRIVKFAIFALTIAASAYFLQSYVNAVAK
jgi:hypothetical protein